MSRLFFTALCVAWACQLVSAVFSDRQPRQKPLAPYGVTRDPSLGTSDAGPPSYTSQLLALHQSLVEIESTTGNENAVGDFLVRYLEEHGYKTKIQVLPSGHRTGSSGPARRFNVVAVPKAVFDGPGWRPRLVITSHIDVVPPHIPYSIDVDHGGTPGPDTIIHGRGSVDAKASVAAQIVAVGSLLSGGAISPNEVLLLYVVGEETTGDGMRFFSESLKSPGGPIYFDAVIFGEPTQNKLACGHKGHMACTVSARGKGGHSGYPWLGKSANEVLMRALLRIVDANLGSSERFGNTTVNIGILQGGVAANVIPESAHARIAVRVAVDSHQVVRDRIEAILREADSEALSITCDNGYGVVECDCDVPGFDTIVVNYGTDVPNFAGKHTRYLYGPGDILVAHSDHEALRVRDLEDAVEGYKLLIKHALGI